MSKPAPAIDRWQTQLQIGSIRAAATEPTLATGRVTRATGLVLHATGLRLPVGAACRIEIARGQRVEGAELAFLTLPVKTALQQLHVGLLQDIGLLTD
ncbi:flagellum-specific ATP synthase domain protein, partial [Bordetella holmesii CDC-H643-BH]